jgi:hydrophobe/amphiphile efflux-3 (HAE3) family protein
MSGLGRGVSKKPAVTIVTILVLSIVFSYFAMMFQSDVDPESFNPDHELIQASEESGDTFGTQEYSLLVIVKPEDKNVLEIDDMKALIELEDDLRSDETVGPAIVPSQNNPTGFASLANMVVLSCSLIQGREDLDSMLMGFDQGISQLMTLLENTSTPNITKAFALDAFLISLNENLTLLQNGNNMIPEFNSTLSLLTLDTVSAKYPSSPVSSHLDVLANYNLSSAYANTAALINSIDSSIDMIMPHLVLLNGTQIDPVTGGAILMGFEFALPTVEAQAQTLDGTIAGLYFGAQATLTRDFKTSSGTTAKGTIINMNFNVTLDTNQRSIVENRVHDIAFNHQGDIEYGVLGNQLINDEIQETMDFSGMFLLMLVFVLIVLILFGTFRNGLDTAMTLISLGMAIMWSLGISVIIGLEGSIIATVVPILLVGLGVDYGIHMTMRFREEKGKARKNQKAIAIAIGTVGMALLLATITTSIGFMSNTVSSLTVLRDFAIMVTIGIVSSFIIMTTFLPAVRLLASERGERKGKVYKYDANSKNTKNNSKRHAISVVTVGAKAADRAPWAVLIILVIISSIAAYGASQLDTVFDFREFIPRNTDAYDNYVFLIDEFEFGDQEFGEIYITGDVATPGVLLAMDETITNTQGDKQVLAGFPARSILSVMQEYANPASQNYNQSFAASLASLDIDGDGIPNSNVTELFDILYNDPDATADVMSVVHKNGDGNYDAALIQVRVSSDNLKKADVLTDELSEDAAPLKNLEGGTLDKVYVIGEPVVINVVVTEMNEGQIRSIIITIVASFVVLTIVFFLLERSFILGAITMIPVLLVILWILGTMIIFGYNLNVMTITIASLTIGMGITYSIHVSERFTEDLKKFKTPGAACENTLTHTGMALAGAFLTTSGGFGILFFHQLPPLQQFGVMIALSIAYSFLASAYVLPTFLILWAKWRNNYRAKRGITQEIIEDTEPGTLEKEKEDTPEVKEKGEPKEAVLNQQNIDIEDGLDVEKPELDDESDLEVKPKMN